MFKTIEELAMTQYALRLPESLYRSAQQMAARDSVSLNQFIALAVAEKVSTLRSAEFFAEKARLADMAAFDRILNAVPDVAPRAGDELQP